MEIWFADLPITNVRFRPHGTTRLPLEAFSLSLVLFKLSTFRKSVEKIQVFLNSDKNNGCFTWRHV